MILHRQISHRPSAPGMARLQRDVPSPMERSARLLWRYEAKKKKHRTPRRTEALLISAFCGVSVVETHVSTQLGKADNFSRFHSISPIMARLTQLWQVGTRLPHHPNLWMTASRSRPWRNFKLTISLLDETLLGTEADLLDMFETFAYNCGDIYFFHGACALEASSVPRTEAISKENWFGYGWLWRHRWLNWLQGPLKVDMFQQLPPSVLLCMLFFPEAWSYAREIDKNVCRDGRRWLARPHTFWGNGSALHL